MGINIDKTFAELASYKQIIAEAEKEVERLEDDIKALMKASDNYVIKGTEHKAMWTTFMREQFETKKFREEHPKIASRYTSVKEQKRFTFA